MVFSTTLSAGKMIVKNNVTYIIIACNIDKGMKSFGSKGLMVFNNKRLLDYQISWIKKQKAKTSEIIIVSDFDNHKIQKAFGKNLKIIDNHGFNPVYFGCSKASSSNICFIDYGCLFNPLVIHRVDSLRDSTIITTDKCADLNVGCITQQDKVEHMFLDLPNNKFCNMFFLAEKDTTKIKEEVFYRRHNLLYFEIINRLVDSGSLINKSKIDPKDFAYFNNMRQKNAISRFIKKYAN